MKKSAPKTILVASIAIFAGLALAATATGANIYWDGGTVDIVDNGNGISEGTAGTWDTTLLNWDIGAVPHVAWNNLNNDTAIFGGTAGVVTLGENVTVGGLRFDTTAYTVTGVTNSKSLTFGAVDNTVLLNNVAATTLSGALVGSGNVTFTKAAPLTAAGTVTLTGLSTGGWTGSTTVNALTTLLIDNDAIASSPNQSLLNTSGITLNGGTITVTDILSAQNLINFVSDSAPITVNGGGSFTWRPINAGPTYSELIGAVTVNSGQMSFATGSISSGSATLVIPSITRNTSTSVLIFSLGNNNSLPDGNANRIQITGAGTTAGWVSGATSNPIVGPWATTGTTAGADYIVYNSDLVVAANTVASSESTWSDASRAYTVTGPSSGATTLTGDRSVLALRNTTTATAVTVTSGNATIPVAGHTFNDGDPVILGGTAPTGFATGTVYYVVNSVPGTSVQLSATVGGTAITPTSAGTGVNVTGGIRLDNQTLGTRGLLNGSAAAMGIAASGGTGFVTLPSSGAGNLYVTPAVALMNIAAPIKDFDAGSALTLVKSGLAALTLSDTGNTYSGGTVLNAGTLNFANNVPLGSTGNVTFAGTATLNGTSAANYSLGSLTVNPGAHGTVVASTSRNYSFTTLSGAGTLVFTSVAGATIHTFTNASGFTGNLGIDNTSAGTQTLQFPNLGDAPGAGNLQLLNRTFAQTQTFRFLSPDTTGLIFNHRKIELVSGGANAALVLENNSASAAASWVINTDLVVRQAGAKALQLAGSNTGANTFAGVIGNGDGTISLTKAGASIWTLGSANTYTGTTTINAGILKLGVAGALGSGNLTLNGGILGLASGNFSRSDGTGAGQYQFGTSGGGFAAYGANRNVSFGGTQNWGTTGLQGTLFLSAADSDATVILTNNISFAGGNRTVNVANGSANIDAQFSGVLSGGGTFNKTGAGTLRIASVSGTYTAVTRVQGGVLEVAKLSNGGVNSSIGASSNAAANLLLDNGTTLRYTGSGDSTDRNFTLNGTAAGNNGILDASGTAALILTNTAAPAYGTTNQSRFLQLTGTNTDGNTLSANLVNNGTGAVNITKNGTGTWILAGNSTYTGATNINAGTLLVTGSLSGTSAVNVASIATLGGTGTIGGLTTIADGGKLSPGTSVGTLTFGSSLDLSSVNTPGTLLFELDTPATSDRVVLTLGTLNLGFGTLGFDDFAFSPLGGFGAGTYTLFDTAASIVGSLDLLNTSGFVGGLPATLALADGDTDLVLNVVPEPSSLALLSLGALGLLRRRRRITHS